MNVPPKLKAGDEIRVLALSRSLGGVLQSGGCTEADVHFAIGRLAALGLKVSFGRCVRECNAHLTASPAQRLEDLHDAFADASVKAILAVTGGMGAIQLLDGINYDLIAAHPKMLCGYSDIAYLNNAILARSGMVSYYGPNFTSFMMRQGADYLVEGFRRCVFDEPPFAWQPSEQWSDDAWHKQPEQRTFHANEGWWCLQPGEAEGMVVGGNYWCLNMVQGSRFFPPLRSAILFLEHPSEGKATLMSLDSGLRALSYQPDFSQVKAIVLGRYAQNAGVTRENLGALLREFPALKHLPVLANCDFGHTMPLATLPIGGRCVLRAHPRQSSIVFTHH